MIDEWEIIRVMAERIYKGRFWAPNDVAFIELAQRKFLAISIDTLVDKTDIPPSMNLIQAGRKAAVSVISDLASKGVKPVGMVFSISMPRRYSIKEAEEIAEGLRRASEEYSFKLIGGDTNESRDLVISCCGFGYTNRILGRDGARPGDIVAVTGLFGLQSLDLRILLAGHKAENYIEKKAVKLVLEPKAKLIEGLTAISTGFVTSSIDSSDGLSLSLYQIADTSKVRIVVDKPPVYPGLEDECKKFEFSLNELVFEGGEEFELIFTVKGDCWDRFKEEFSRRGLEIYRIGKVVEGSGVFLVRNNEEIKLRKKGWMHFKRNSEIY
ncbi:thiamine-phosphate kinase [Candidatus Geothermarchaeota archaeon]|nr:MAG: thiamine-phosphate kinase [Candidatus Geothermarchaeota archaeon]